MQLNLIAETINDSLLPQHIQCTPTYCNLEPGSNRVSVGLKNIPAKKITIPTKAVICQVQLANMVPKVHAPIGQVSSKSNQEDDGSWILEQLDMGGLEQWTDEQQHAA